VEHGGSEIQEISRLEALGADAADSPAFAALAEAHRRAGDPERARRLAQEGLQAQPDHVAGRVALALALIDLGRAGEAGSALEAVLDQVPDHPLVPDARHPLVPDGRPGFGEANAELAPVAEAEIDAAFDLAESQTDEMVSANHLAEAALQAVEGDLPEGIELTGADSPFATETVAGLLEAQGHEQSADQIRATLAPPGPATGLDSERRGRWIATLERWLENLRRTTK